MTQIQTLHRRSSDDHLEDSGDTVAECYLLLHHQPNYCLRIVFAGVDLLVSKERRPIGQAPGMYMEHGGEWHIYLMLVQAAVVANGCHRAPSGNGLQYKLPVGEADSLGLASRASGVAQGGLGVLVKIGQFIQRTRRSQEFLILCVYCGVHP